MKKWWILLTTALLLTGCAKAETFEKVDDELLEPVMAEAGEISLALPEGAAAQTMLTGEGDKLYFCEDYTVTVQTMARGDLHRTIKNLCGFDREGLKVVETGTDGLRCWDWVWTAVGEGGDAIGRAAVIDDGKYHYCVTVMADAGLAGALEGEWTALLQSFAVS